MVKKYQLISGLPLLIAMAPGIASASPRSVSSTLRDKKPVVLTQTEVQQTSVSSNDSFSAFGSSVSESPSTISAKTEPKLKLQPMNQQYLLRVLQKNSSSGQAGSRFDGVKVVGDVQELVRSVGNCTTSSLSGNHMPGMPGICYDNSSISCTTDADCSLSLTISDVTMNEGNSGTTTFTHTVELNFASSVPTQVNYATSDVTATAGSDYTAASGTVTIPTGQRTATINITVHGDELVEPDETYHVTLSGPINSQGSVILNKHVGVGTILNDDVAPAVNSVSVPLSGTYGAGQNLDFTVNASKNLTVNTASGIPFIELTIGSDTRYATYTSGSGTSALLFRYTIVPGDMDADGIEVSAAINLNSGTIRDAAGNNITTTLNSVGNTSAVLVSTNIPPVNTVAPSVSGTATVGNALSATDGTWTDADGDPLTYSRQWYRADDASGTNLVAIGGATASSYTLTTSDAHKYLRVVVTANDGNGGTTPANSPYTQITNSAPVNTVAPSVSGTATVGNALSTTNGSWTDADGDSRTYSYQWYRADDNSGTGMGAIGGATGSSYILTTLDAHKYIRVVVTANDGYGGNTSANSIYTQVTNSAPVNTVAPAVTGTTTVGGTLSTTSGTWTDADGDSRTYSYQWYRADDAISTNLAAIGGATASSYTLTASDARKFLRVTVTANDGNGGTQTADSTYTAVTNSPPTNITLDNTVINQSGGVDAVVGTLGSVDPDGDTNFTYSLVTGSGDTDNASFNISGSSLRANDAGALAASLYSIRILTDDGAGGTYPRVFTITVLDDVAPSVVSIAPASGAAPDSSSVNFTVTFSEPVTSVSDDDFTLTTTGNAVGTIASVSGSGAVYAVTVNNITGSGTIRLDVRAGTNIADAAGNASPAYSGGTAHTVDIPTVPDAPIVGTATAGNGQASVTFTAPANNGGAAITGYTVTSNPGGFTGTGAGSPITVTGLTNGTAYTFTVTATNSAGTSTASAASNSIRPAAPQTITFNNPGAQNFGTSPTLTATANSNLPVSFSSSTTGVCTITSGGVLTFVTTGSCTIRADQAGDSSYSAAPQVEQTFNVNAVAPAAPTSPVATAGENQASVTFTAPVNTGGVAITGYTVTSNPGGFTGTGSGSPVIVTGLTNGVAYTFTVTANNVAGTSPASVASNSITPAAIQTITFANPGAQNFGTTPTLTATTDATGLTPTFTSATAAVCTITSGGALTFVTAGSCTINADQAGNASYLPAAQVSNTFTVNPVVPGIPTTVVATAGDATASVAFAAPVNTGGVNITTYTVTSNPGGLTASGTASPITVTGLTNDTAYTFTVTATNSAGTGAASAASNSVTPALANLAPELSGTPATSVAQGQAYSFVPTATDPNGDTLTFSITNKPSWASFNTATGALTGTPARADVGVTAGIVISVSDGELSASLPAFNLEVTAVNEAPVAVDDVFTLPFSTSGVYELDVLANDSDPDGDALTITNASTSIGTVVVADNKLRFTAPENFNGIARLDYRISDGELSAQAKVLLTIDGSNPQAPVISGVDDIRVNASGIFTKVDLGVVTARDVNGNRIPVTLVNGAPVFKSGVHEALWRATDSNGLSSTVTQTVKVVPQVSIGKSRQVTNHSLVTVEFMLNGESPEYPVLLPYTVAGTADMADHDLSDGHVEITSGVRGSLAFNVFANLSAVDDKTITITLDNTLNLARNGNAVVTVTEANLAPVVVLTAEQQGTHRLLVTKDGGEVRVVSQVTDPNGDNVSLSWQAEPLLANTSSDNSVFAFDPSSVNNGVYQITLVATDDHATSPLSGSASVLLVVRDSLPVLGNEDSNGNLIPDSVEGLGDSNGNGIPDYLDPGFDCNVMVEQLAQSSRFLTEAEPGICISRGRVALESNSGGLELFNNQLQLMEPDTQARPIGGVFDFVLSGLPVQGESYYFVVPQRAAIPEGAVYRKFTEADGWKNFVQNSANQLFSAAGEQGYCPAPGDASWQPGLTIGHWCVQLLIEDGGPNDADGTVNGRIVDPGGVSVLLNGNTFPVAEDDTYSVMWNQMHVLDVLENDSDADGDTLTITSASALFGTVVISDDGQLLEYTPQIDYLGTDTVTYSISDGLGGSATAQASVTVYENRVPVVSGVYTAATNNKTAIELQVLSVVTDADGDTLTVTAASAQHGSVSIVNSQLIRYTPQAGYTGTDVVSFTVSDGRGGEVTGVANVNVTDVEVIRVDNKSSGGALGIISGLFLGLLAFCRRHHMSVLVAAIVSLFSAGTVADEQWSVEAQVGKSKARLSAADIARALPAGAEVLAYDRRDTSWSLGVNFRLAEKLWLQGHYVDLGDATVSIGGEVSDADAFHRAVSKHGALLVEGVKTGLAYSIAESDSGTLSLQIQGGVFSWWGERESRQGSTMLKSDTSDTDVYWGLQGAYRLTEKGGVTVGFNRYHLEGNKVDNISVGVRWYF